FIHPVFEYHSNTTTVPVTASSLVSSNELAIQMGLPRKSVCGLPVIEHADFGKEVVRYDEDYKKGKEISLGKVFSMGRETETEVNLDCDSLTMHTFITGSTGSGKSNTVYKILNELMNFYNIPFLVIEPAKGEYKNVFGQFSNVTVYGTNPKVSELLKINPFKFPKGIHVLEHLDRLVEIFNVCWPMYAAMPAILKEAMEKSYVAVGWDLSTSENEKGDKYPNFADLLEQIECIIDNSEYSIDTKGDYSGALLTRVRSLTNGLNGQIFCADDLKDEDLFDKNVIIDLSRVGSTETKSLIMGLLVMKLNEYRMDLGKSNSPLSHVTVLEEAHNLLKRTSTEQLSEGSNLLGKSVELLSNSIAEMRTYGEGFIIADQSPGLLDMSVIRNTNTKIILRLPEKTDRELVGYAASLNEEQIDELAKLKKGVAAVYQNDWVEPVLVQVNKCKISEKPYDFNLHKKIRNTSECYLQLIYFFIQGRIFKDLEFDINEIEESIDNFKLSTRNINFVEEMIAEYKETGKLELWNNSNFEKLATKVTDILGVRSRVEKYILIANDYEELTKILKNIIIEMFPKMDDEEIIYTLSQCFMKDMSLQKDEQEIRKNIYKCWVGFIKERSV
ncbi:MAG: ATP-binding protein, partial [Clostridium sp.]|nr:ATP-binding protein [Clostridium sp.]